MDAQLLLASDGGRHGPRVTDHKSRITLSKLFRFTLLSKNVPASRLESHSCKNKGLKVPCFHTLTKKGVGEGGVRVSKPEMVVLLALRYEGSEHREPMDLCPDLTSLTSTLTKNASATPLASTLTGFTLVKS